MKFTDTFLDEVRGRLPVSQVVGRKVALKKKGREFAGLSPFKTEKTPSFFVNDQKGFYHCFASGEHGDIFTFLMKTEGLSFPEAVERLANEAGLEVPRPDPREKAQADVTSRQLALMEDATSYFEACLASGGGTDARRYIQKRGLGPDTVRDFRIGFAPNGRTSLKDHLAKKGYAIDEMIATGMLIGGEDIAQPYDRFRNRLMFPIADLKGRIIAFGGRALSGDQPAKYLNSPETRLFHKGSQLFNAHRARQAAFDRDRLIAVEGYMDVISLVEAGFAEAVAPLGTALTDDQLKMMWRMTPEPILCFDGDSAGQKAAFRAIDTALPHLRPGASLMFAFLPDGLDPDDLVREQGRQALDGVLSRARPLVDVLFERAWQQGDWSTPERRAGLEHNLRQLVDRIGDQTVKSYYRQDLFDRLSEAWGRTSVETRRVAGARGSSQGAYRSFDARSGWSAGQGMGRAQSPQGWNSGRRNGAVARTRDFRTGGGSLGFGPQGVSAALKKSALVSGDSVSIPYREALILRALLNHPWLLDDHAEDLATLAMTSMAAGRLRDALLSAHALEISLDTESLRSHLNNSGVGSLLTLVERAVSHKCDRFAEPDAGRTEVEDGWRHALAMHERHVGLKRSLEMAEQALLEDGSEASYARICELKQELEQLIGADADDV